MERVDIIQAKTHTKKLLFSVVELADKTNEIGKGVGNYKVEETIFRLHRPLRQFQSQLRMLSENFEHSFVQVEDPAFPTFEGWGETDKVALKHAVDMLEEVFGKVNEDIKQLSCVDHAHSSLIRASWTVLNDFYEVLKGNPRPDYL